MRSFGSLGWVVGFALAATALTVWPQHAEWVLVVAALAMVTAPFSWAGGSRPQRKAADRHLPRAWGATSAAPVRAVLGLLVVTFPISLTMSTLVQFTAGSAHRSCPPARSWPSPLSPSRRSWSCRSSRSSTGWLAPVHPLLIAALAGPPLAVATAVLALFPSSASMLAVQPLIAIGFSLLFVGQSRLLAAAVPAGLQASAQTLGSALTGGVGGLIAGVVGGRVADSLGYGGLFSCLVVLAAVGSAVGGSPSSAPADRATPARRSTRLLDAVASAGCTVPANQ